MSDSDFGEQRIRPIQATGLPYLVAVDNGTLVAYTCAAAYIPHREGYFPAVEFSLFVHPDKTKMGIGSALLTMLLRVLRAPADHADYVEPQADGTFRKPDQVIGIMAVDEEVRDRGLWLRHYYARWGFREAGRLHRVGLKFGRM